MGYVFERSGAARPPRHHSVMIDGGTDPDGKPLPPVEACRILFEAPGPDELWAVEHHMLPIDLKLQRFRLESKHYVVRVVEEVPRLEVTRADLEPLVEWLVDRIVGFEGLEDAEGTPHTVEALGRDGVGELLFTLGFDAIMDLNATVRASVGLRPAVGNGSEPTSPSSTREGASAPNAKEDHPSAG